MFGHCGRILRVDLSSGEIETENLDSELARAFLGGNGFAAKLIYDGVKPDAKPLDEGNALVFTVGPLTDTRAWGSSRGHLASISPLMGLFADSNFGGNFATAQKRTGFDAIYITGKSEKPVYLRVTEKGGELADAAQIWGMTTEETNKILQDEQGKGAVSMCIGPAGENLVSLANIICDGVRPGAAGRGGLGAVMGSKKLKAVVVRGSRKTEVAQPEKLTDFLKNQRDLLMSNSAILTETGTPSLVNMINEKGILCTHNAAKETFEFANDISDTVLKQKYIVKKSACYGCAVACGKIVNVPSGEYAGQTLKMPEYETIYALGSMLDNHDMVSVMNANGVCDLYGIDTISMGVTLSFVAECMEKGLVTAAELGGKVTFGDGPGIVELVKATAGNKGIGAILAQGSLKLAQRFGGDAYKYLYCTKGLEISGHSARGLRPLGLGYATATRGGSHQDTRPKYLEPDEDPGFEGQVEYNIKSQHFTAVGDSLIMCRFLEERAFGSANNDGLSRIVNYVTGWDTDVKEIEAIGERIYNVERLINVERGVSRKDDVLPWRTMNEPIPEGPAKGRYCSQENLQRQLDEYYQMRGWTEDGVPSEKKLAELGLKA